MAEIPDSAPIFEEPPRREFGKFCLHASYTVIDEQRKILCRTCNGQLDAFDLILRLAHRQAHRENIEKEITELRKTLAALRAEEKRCKARTRNARKKDADAAVAKALAGREEGNNRAVYRLLDVRAEIDRVLKHLGHEEDTGQGWRERQQL